MSRSSIYKNLSAEKYQELFSNYLLDSWSYSKVESFSRNEKAFEMNYIYGYPLKMSSTSVAGSAYHKALELYFSNKQKGTYVDIVELQKSAYEYINKVPANKWKLQATTPSINDCVAKATKIVNSAIDNFFNELGIYDLDEILYVEVFCNNFLVVNGVDIPIPCKSIVDLIGKKDGKVVMIDHKLKNSFTKEKEIVFSVGKQAITYYNNIFEELNFEVDEIWFIENKYSKNRDKSNQLNLYKIPIDTDSIRLYESLLYEPLKRMIEAISNPDYVYLINESDNFTDKAELHLFWTETLISEVDSFNIDPSKKHLIDRRLKKIRDASLAQINPKIIKNFRQNTSSFIEYNIQDKDMTAEEKIEHTLRTFNTIVQVEKKLEGFSCDTYLLKASAGTNLSSIQKYKLDIANALNVSSIRINKDLKIYEGQSYLAIESPKKQTETLFYDSSYLKNKKIPLGISNTKEVVFWDLENQSTPHMLICGATGSGKSVSIISTLEYALESGVDDIIILDPKFEFTEYDQDSRVSVYNEIEDIEEIMELLVDEMNSMVRNNKSAIKLIIFDEFGDAVASSRKGKELKVYGEQVVGMYKNGLPKTKRVHIKTLKSLEENLKILGQKGRSSGFRILAATQRASVKVITGDTKVNFPVQVCFRVPKEIDSKVVIDEPGAETLSGKGDGLIKSPEFNSVIRFQGFFKD